MKVMTKEEEQAHYDAVLAGGMKWGVVGLGLSSASAYLLHRRSANFRRLTLPIKVFLVSAVSTFTVIVGSDQGSRGYEGRRYGSFDETEQRRAAIAKLHGMDKALAWASDNRYKVIAASWVASVAGATAVVSRDKFLSTSQKIVQVRMYAQGVTLLVLLASAALTISDDRQARHHHKTQHSSMSDEWKEMVAAEWEREKIMDARKQK